MRFTRGFTLALTLALVTPAFAQSPEPAASAAPSPEASAAPRSTGTGDGGPPADGAGASNAPVSHGTGAGGPPAANSENASGPTRTGTGAGGPPQAPPTAGAGAGGTGAGGPPDDDDGPSIGTGGGGGGGFGGLFEGMGRGPYGGRGGPGGLHGLARLIRPERSQWLGMARFAIHVHRAGATHLANLVALRLEIVEQVIAQKLDEKVLDARVDALSSELQKASDAVVDLIFEGRELLTPEQRKAVTERMALCLIGATGGAEQLEGHGKRGTPPAPSSGGGWAGRAGGGGWGGHAGGKSWWPFGRKDRGPGAPGRGPGGPGAPHAGPPPPPPPPFHLEFEQQAQLKRMLIHASPAFARAAGEAMAQGLTVADEFLNENPAKDKVKAAMDAIVAQAVVMLKTGTGLVKEARGVLSARQIEEALAHAPVPLLLGGMAAMRHHRPPPPPPGW